MSRFIVTGAAGFVGSHIAELCVKEGHTVLGIDNLSSGHLDNIRDLPIEFEKVDITAPESLLSLARLFKPDAISHQAAQPSLRTSIERPEFDAQVNIIGTLNIIRAARETGARLVTASTSAVYDHDGNLPYLEDDDIAPSLPYGISKAAAEMYVLHSGVNAAVLRYANVFGEKQRVVGENQLIPHCLNHLLHDKPFKINGDGSKSRDFIYVKDVARANLMAMQSGAQGVFNISTGESFTIENICFSLAYLCNRPDYVFEHGEAKSGEAEHTLLDPSKALKELGWKARVQLEDGLRATVRWYKGK